MRELRWYLSSSSSFFFFFVPLLTGRSVVVTEIDWRKDGVRKLQSWQRPDSRKATRRISPRDILTPDLWWLVLWKLGRALEDVLVATVQPSRHGNCRVLSWFFLFFRLFAFVPLARYLGTLVRHGQPYTAMHELNLGIWHTLIHERIILRTVMRREKALMLFCFGKSRHSRCLQRAEGEPKFSGTLLTCSLLPFW